MARVREIPLWVVGIACLTLGLAPYTPPHVVEKVRMLAAGELSAPIDVLDLVLHSSPWLLLASWLAAGRGRTPDETGG